MRHEQPNVPGASYVRERQQMVEYQIAARGVTDERVLNAMRQVPRHAFVAPESVGYAHEDRAMPIGQGQTISQPYMVAAMTQLLELEPTDHILEVGTGSGYQAAILATLGRDVVTIERVPRLADAARRRLRALGYGNVTVVDGDGTLGFPVNAPYNAIIVTAGGPAVPEALKTQLAVGGRLVCPVGPREIQHLAVVRRTETNFQERLDIGCVFVPLIGAEGWSEGVT